MQAYFRSKARKLVLENIEIVDGHSSFHYLFLGARGRVHCSQLKEFLLSHGNSSETPKLSEIHCQWPPLLVHSVSLWCLGCSTCFYKVYGSSIPLAVRVRAFPNLDVWLIRYRFQVARGGEYSHNLVHLRHVWPADQLRLSSVQNIAFIGVGLHSTTARALLLQAKFHTMQSLILDLKAYLLPH